MTRIRRILSPLRVQQARLWWRFRLAGMKRVQVPIPGGEIHAWVTPSPRRRENPPLLLVHGFGADASWQWEGQVRAFARRHRLIVPDLLFFGDSHTTSADRSLDVQVDALLRLLDACGVDEIDVVGISYGGLVAYALAHFHPGRVKRLVLVSSPGPMMRSADYDELLARWEVDSIQELLLPQTAEDVKRLMKVAWHQPPWVPAFALRDARRRLFAWREQEKAELLEELRNLLREIQHQPLQVSQPSLLVWGREDRVFPLEIASRLQAFLAPSSLLHVIEEAAHAPNLERPKEFNRVVMEYLAGNSAPGGGA